MTRSVLPPTPLNACACGVYARGHRDAHGHSSGCETQACALVRASCIRDALPSTCGTGFSREEIQFLDPPVRLPRRPSCWRFRGSHFLGCPSVTPMPIAWHPKNGIPPCFASVHVRKSGQDIDLQALKTSAAGGSQTRSPSFRSRGRFLLGMHPPYADNDPGEAQCPEDTVEDRSSRPRRRWSGRSPLTSGPWRNPAF